MLSEEGGIGLPWLPKLVICRASPGSELSSLDLRELGHPPNIAGSAAKPDLETPKLRHPKSNSYTPRHQSLAESNNLKTCDLVYTPSLDSRHTPRPLHPSSDPRTEVSQTRHSKVSETVRFDPETKALEPRFMS